MKVSITVAVGTVFLLVAGMPLAQDAKAPALNPNAPAMQSGASTNMRGQMGQMGQMDEHMKKMQTLHDKMMSAASPDERQKIMGEQRKEMQAAMGMMKDMQGGAMMGGMGGGSMGQMDKSADAGAQMQMMHKRMDMMQMMMQMMMDQQGMTGSPKGAK